MKRKRLCLAGYTLVAAASLGCSRSPGLTNPTAAVVESSPNVQHAVAAAWEADRSGESERALAMYLDVLSEDPNNAWAKRRVEQLSVNLPAQGEMIANADQQPPQATTAAIRRAAAEAVVSTTTQPDSEAASDPFEDWTIESERRTSAQPASETSVASSIESEKQKATSAEVFPWASQGLAPVEDSIAKEVNPKSAKSKSQFNDEALFDSIAKKTNPFEDSVAFHAPAKVGDSSKRGIEARKPESEPNNPFESLANLNKAPTNSTSPSKATPGFADMAATAFPEAPAIKTVSFSQPKETEIPLKPTQKRLVDLCSDANTEILSLVSKLDSPVASTRRAGLQGLGLLGERAQTAKLPVRIMFGDDEPVVSAEAAWTLWQIDGDAFQSVRHLASLISSTDVAAADAAVQSLGLIGKDAIAAAPQLRDQLNKLSGVRRVRIAESLIRIQPEDVGALQALIESTRYGRSVERTEATYALAHTPTVHIETITPVLVNALHDENEAVRTAAALTLGSFGPRAEHARLALESAAEYDYPHVRDAARAALDCLPK